MNFSNYGAILGASLFKPKFKGSLSDLIELAKKTSEEKIKRFGFNLDYFIKTSLSPLYLERVANIRKKGYSRPGDHDENNLFYCYDDFYSILKSMKANLDKWPILIEEIKQRLEKESEDFENRLRDLTGFLGPFLKKYPDLDIDKILEKYITIIKGLRDDFQNVRKEGGQFKPFNVLIYELVNRLTFFRRASNGSAKIVRLSLNWDFIIFILLWLHFHKIKFKELEPYLTDDENLSKLKKKLQRIYSHFDLPWLHERKNMRLKDVGIGFKRVILTDNSKYRIIYK